MADPLELALAVGLRDSSTRRTSVTDAMEQTTLTLDDIPSVIDPKSEEAALDRIMFSETLQIIETLPAAQRSVLMLVCIEGNTYAEAADRLGICIGTVMSRIHVARGKLRARLLPDDQ